MSKEQIIVDGVDVSGCEWIREIGLDSEYICICNSSNMTSCYCKDNPNCYYKLYKRKEQECDFLKNITTLQSKDIHDKKQQLNQLKVENEKMEKGYIELTEIVTPYIDDFTGYNEEQCGFDIVLCVKELIQQLDQLKEEVEKQRALKQTYLTCYKAKHGDVKGRLFKYERYKEALQNIKRIIEVNKAELEECLVHDIDDQILQKISEVEG